MSPTRHVKHIEDEGSSVAFTLVLRDGADKVTLGSKRLSVLKPLDLVKIRKAINDAIAEMVTGSERNEAELLQALVKELNQEQ